jgi:hypothetical protein
LQPTSGPILRPKVSHTSAQNRFPERRKKLRGFSRG